MEKMVDEICGSLKLMRRANREREEQVEGEVIVSVFAVANKRQTLHFGEPVYSFWQRKGDREQKTGLETNREREPVRFVAFSVSSAADVSALAV